MGKQPQYQTQTRRGAAKVRRPCPTGKKQFGTRLLAQQRLDQVEREPDRGKLYRPVAVAPRCRSCGLFHLTSNIPKPQRVGKRRRRQW